MAGRAVVEVEGAKRLRATLKAAGDDLSDLRDVHNRVAGVVTPRARGTAPKRSGTLAGSVRGSGTKTQAVIRAGGARVPYAGPIHFGWPARGIEPQPFISEAAQATEPQWFGIYQDEVEEILDRVKGI